MFAQLGVWLTTFLTNYVSAVVGRLAAGLTPIALIWLTVYIANYGYAVTRGEASDPFSTFAWKMVKMMFILAFALRCRTLHERSSSARQTACRTAWQPSSCEVAGSMTPRQQQCSARWMQPTTERTPCSSASGRMLGCFA